MLHYLATEATGLVTPEEHVLILFSNAGSRGACTLGKQRLGLWVGQGRGGGQKLW